MKVTREIKIKERQVDYAREALADTYAEFKQVLRQRLSSRTALVVSFGSGVALGLLKRRRRESPRLQLPQKAREAMPKHWFGHYIVWPFLLASARDWVVSHRPQRAAPRDTTSATESERHR